MLALVKQQRKSFSSGGMSFESEPYFCTSIVVESYVTSNSGQIEFGMEWNCTRCCIRYSIDDLSSYHDGCTRARSGYLIAVNLVKREKERCLVYNSADTISYHRVYFIFDRRC